MEMRSSTGSGKLKEHYSEASIIHQIALAIGVLVVLEYSGLGAMLDPFTKTADNFCAQVRYFVHVAFAILRHFRSVAQLLQKKNIMISLLIL